jgi:hypothetical protein
VINRTLVYAALTFMLGAVFAATTLALGTALGSGSSWATAGATSSSRWRSGRCALGCRTREVLLRAIVDVAANVSVRVVPACDIDRNGLHRSNLQGLRDVLSDPQLELLFYLPESQVYVDARGVPVEGGFPRDGREVVPIERGGQPLAIVLHDRRADEHPSLLQEVVEAGGLAIEIARLRVELRRQLSEVEGSGRGSSLQRTTNAGASSAISTTAPSSGWSRSALRFGTRSTNSPQRRRMGARDAGRRRRRDRGRDRRAARALARPPAVSARRRARPCAPQSSPRERRCPCSHRAQRAVRSGLEAAACFIACEGSRTP